MSFEEIQRQITQGFVGQGKNRELYLECNGQLLNFFFS